jgi:hypothetical protein
VLGNKKSAKSRNKNRNHNLKRKKKLKFKQKLEKLGETSPASSDEIDDITFQATLMKQVPVPVRYFNPVLRIQIRSDPDL